ncbi:MAG TPA: AmmeMemoRadiSam system protein B [Candidatus Hydrogenedentes bacterium]|nr:AmmeMemoRadiSam system protein B [Candidatus Hydrogenedentota bacterium]HQH50808.1 AmmeMemoRadiSam system protein B [Candidatus Hydrogenedentota bacterium]
MNSMTRRATAVAGQFYPSSPEKLAGAVRAFMDDSEVQPAPDAVRALIVPHAGYMYSGPTAGFAYQRIKGKQPKRVVLLGCSHRYAISRASVFVDGVFETPLGEFPIDSATARTLAQRTDSQSAEPHLLEHALEVQLPFLHAACGGPVPLVPILFGSHSSWHAELGRELADILGQDDLVVASTDLSHYLSQDKANQIDQRTLNAILSKDTDEVGWGIDEQRYSMCGSTAVICAMAFATATGADTWRLLDYRTSADASKDYSQVVGYAAVSMETA